MAIFLTADSKVIVQGITGSEGTKHPRRMGASATEAGGRAPRAVCLTADSKVIVQGITGSEGTKHTRRMVSSGTKVVGGVNPRKAGTDVDGIPVFATVAEAMSATGADASAPRSG